MDSREAQKQKATDTHSQQAGEFAEAYLSFEQDVYGTCFTYSRYRLDKLLARYLPAKGNGASVLDVGCGTGRYMSILRQRGYSVAGVDGSVEMLAHARTNNPGADIRESDVERLPFDSAQFDFVVCIEVLRYLPSFELAVREMARVLKPGGVCLVTATPTLNLNGYYLINRIANAMPVGNLVRLKQFFSTSWRLRRGFEFAGFANPRIHGVYIGPVNWIEHLSPKGLPSFLRRWEMLDSKVADVAGLREFANMFLIAGTKEA